MRTFSNIAKLVREKRLANPKGLSQNDLSKLLGYKNGQFISNVERGLCGVPFKNLNKLCEILLIEQPELKAAILKDVEETVNNYLNVSTGETTIAPESGSGDRRVSTRELDSNLN